MSSQVKSIEGNGAQDLVPVYLPKGVLEVKQKLDDGRIIVTKVEAEQVTDSQGDPCSTEICQRPPSSATNDSAVSTRNPSKTMKIWAEVLKFVGGIFSSIGAPTATLVSALIAAGILLGPVVAKIAIVSFIVAVLEIVILGISVLLEKLEPILYPKKA